MQERQKRSGFYPLSGRFPGGGNGYSPQYSCLENSMDRGAWWAIAHGFTKSWTWLSNKHTHVVDEPCCVSFMCTAKWTSYTYIYSFSNLLFLFRLLQNVKPFSVLYSRSLLVYVLNTVVCICPCQTLDQSLSQKRSLLSMWLWYVLHFPGTP